MGRWIFYFVFCLELTSSLLASEDSAQFLLRYKPRLKESIYSYYSRSETLFTNLDFQKYVSSRSEAYVGLKTLKTLENGHLVQQASVQAGKIVINDQTYSHPALGHRVDYVLAPWGGIPKAIGTGYQYQIKNLQLVLPKKPVSVGTSWIVTFPATPNFPAPTEVYYEVTNIVGSLVILHAGINMEDVTVGRKLKISVKGQSQIIFNSEEGLMVRNESNQYVEVSRPSKEGTRSTRMNVNSILELQF